MIKARYNAKVFSGKTADLENSDRIFAKNEIIIDEDTGDAKFGNGEDKYSDLPDLGGSGGDVDLSEYAKTSDLGDLAGKNESDLNLSDKADKSELSDYAKESDLQSLISRVEALENEE